jgi:hypothetical protein
VEEISVKNLTDLFAKVFEQIKTAKPFNLEETQVLVTHSDLSRIIELAIKWNVLTYNNDAEVRGIDYRIFDISHDNMRFMVEYNHEEIRRIAVIIKDSAADTAISYICIYENGMDVSGRKSDGRMFVVRND